MHCPSVPSTRAHTPGAGGELHSLTVCMHTPVQDSGGKVLVAGATGGVGQLATAKLLEVRGLGAVEAPKRCLSCGCILCTSMFVIVPCLLWGGRATGVGLREGGATSDDAHVHCNCALQPAPMHSCVWVHWLCPSNGCRQQAAVITLTFCSSVCRGASRSVP